MEVGKCAKQACNKVKQTYLLFYCRHLMSVFSKDIQSMYYYELC